MIASDAAGLHVGTHALAQTQSLGTASCNQQEGHLTRAESEEQSY